MFSVFTKKNTLTQDQLVNIFVNVLMESADETFGLISEYLDETPDLEIAPNLQEEQVGKFILVVLAGNVINFQNEVQDGTAQKLTYLLMDKISKIFGMNINSLMMEVKNCQGLIKDLNFKSKKWQYGLSRAFYHLCNLYPYSSEHFRDNKIPNPIVLKQLDQIFERYIWNVSAYKEEYKIVG